VAARVQRGFIVPQDAQPGADRLPTKAEWAADRCGIDRITVVKAAGIKRAPERPTHERRDIGRRAGSPGAKPPPGPAAADHDQPRCFDHSVAIRDLGRRERSLLVAQGAECDPDRLGADAELRRERVSIDQTVLPKLAPDERVAERAMQTCSRNTLVAWASYP
jgi:hypothetical protein